MIIRVGNNFFIASFVIIDVDAQHMLLIFRRSFLATTRALMDLQKDVLILRVEEK